MHGGLSADWTVNKRAHVTGGRALARRASSATPPAPGRPSTPRHGSRTLRMCRWLNLLVSRIRPAPSCLVGGGRQALRKALWPLATNSTNASTTHVSERPTVRARVRVHTDTRPSHAWAVGTEHWAGQRGGLAVPCAPAQPRPGPRHVPPLSGGRCPLSSLSPSAVGTRDPTRLNI